MLDRCDNWDMRNEEEEGKEKHSEKELAPARNSSDTTLSDELNNRNLHRWCSKGKEYTKTQNPI